MEKTNKYLMDLQDAINFYCNALEDGDKWVKEDGDEKLAGHSEKIIPRPVVYGFTLMGEDILDEICHAGKEQIPFFVDRLKDKGLLWITDKVLMHYESKPSVGGKFGEELEKLHERINEMASVLYDVVRRAEGMADVEKSVFSKKEINLDELRKFFSDAFNGKVKNEIDHFQFQFLYAWRSKKKLTAKDHARIAYMIHQNKKWTKPEVGNKTFKSFYQEFCMIVGCKYNQEYKPNKLADDIGDMGNTFYFLKNY